MIYANEQAPAVYYQCQPEENPNLKFVSVREFDLNRTINSLQGQPTLEIAGPTHRGYPIIDNRLPSAPIVTNILPTSTDYETVDVLADFKRLPFRSGTFGMVLASCISIYNKPNDDPATARYNRHQAFDAYSSYVSFGGIVSERTLEKNPRLAAIEEAARILVQGGLLVWQGGNPEDVEIADLNGLRLSRFDKRDPNNPYPDRDAVKGPPMQCVFQKR